jgi:hypothetical protein
MSRPNLEEELTTGLAELRSILGSYSTYAVTAQCFGYMIGTAHSKEAERDLMSPAKQIPFLLSVLLSTAEPETPSEFGEAGWKRVTHVVGNLFSVYMLLYMPKDCAARQNQSGVTWDN